MENLPSRLERAAAAEKCLMEMGVDVIHDMGTGWYFDVFHPHGGSRIATFRRNLLSLPPLLQLRERFSPSRRRWFNELRTLEQRQLALRGAIIITVSQMVQTHLQRFHKVPPSRMRLIYSGVNTLRFSPEHRAAYPAPIRSELGLDREILFLLVAHNFRLKGVDTPLRAMHLMAAAGHPVHLAVIGRGAIDAYKHMAARLGVGELVTFCGPVDDPRPYYAAADAYVHPTFYNPCSLTLLEAWASGLPVITSRFNGAAELMTHGAHGFVNQSPRDARELAGKMELLLSQSLRMKIAASARLLAMQHPIERRGLVKRCAKRGQAATSQGRSWTRTPLTYCTPS